MNIAITDNRRARVLYDDLREWIVEADKLGELVRLRSAFRPISIKSSCPRLSLLTFRRSPISHFPTRWLQPARSWKT